jgi:hypothetical protein
VIERREQLITHQRLASAVEHREQLAWQVDQMSWTHPDSRQLPAELRNQLSGRDHLPTCSDLDQLRAWNTDTEQLLAQAHAARRRIEKQREAHRQRSEEARQTLDALREEARGWLDDHGDDLDPDSCAELYGAVSDPGSHDARRPQESDRRRREAITGADDALATPDPNASDAGWPSADQQPVALSHWPKSSTAATPRTRGRSVPGA